MDKEDTTLLRIIDGLWETYEWVPIGEVSKRTRMKRLEFKSRIRALERKGLIAWKPKVLHDKPGVKILEKGVDRLAVWDFMKHGVVDDIGNVIGEGKESVIVLGLKDGEKLAMKFHRYYSAEFRRIKESLSYSAIKWWKEKKGRQIRPVDFPRAKAQVEYRALRGLEGKVSVPKARGINRHVIVMDMIGDNVPAPLLSQTKKEAWMKDVLLDEYDKAVKEGFVHGDFSPFNIMVWDKLYIIDWPQAVPADFENAGTMAERDRERISSAFSS